eukprot:352687-Chlamydomonas_euryale.AAC.4
MALLGAIKHPVLATTTAAEPAPAPLLLRPTNATVTSPTHTHMPSYAKQPMQQQQSPHKKQALLRQLTNATAASPTHMRRPSPANQSTQQWRVPHTHVGPFSANHPMRPRQDPPHMQNPHTCTAPTHADPPHMQALLVLTNATVTSPTHARTCRPFRSSTAPSESSPAAMRGCAGSTPGPSADSTAASTKRCSSGRPRLAPPKASMTDAPAADAADVRRETEKDSDQCVASAAACHLLAAWRMPTRRQPRPEAGQPRVAAPWPPWHDSGHAGCAAAVDGAERPHTQPGHCHCGGCHGSMHATRDNSSGTRSAPATPLPLPPPLFEPAIKEPITPPWPPSPSLLPLCPLLLAWREQAVARRVSTSACTAASMTHGSASGAHVGSSTTPLPDASTSAHTPRRGAADGGQAGVADGSGKSSATASVRRAQRSRCCNWDPAAAAAPLPRLPPSSDTLCASAVAATVAVRYGRNDHVVAACERAYGDTAADALPSCSEANTAPTRSCPEAGCSIACNTPPACHSTSSGSHSVGRAMSVSVGVKSVGVKSVDGDAPPVAAAGASQEAGKPPPTTLPAPPPTGLMVCAVNSGGVPLGDAKRTAAAAAATAIRALPGSVCAPCACAVSSAAKRGCARKHSTATTPAATPTDGLCFERPTASNDAGGAGQNLARRHGSRVAPPPAAPFHTAPPPPSTPSALEPSTAAAGRPTAARSASSTCALVPWKAKAVTPVTPATLVTPPTRCASCAGGQAA